MQVLNLSDAFNYSFAMVADEAKPLSEVEAVNPNVHVQQCDWDAFREGEKATTATLLMMPSWASFAMAADDVRPPSEEEVVKPTSTTAVRLGCLARRRRRVMAATLLSSTMLSSTALRWQHVR